jgi:hypothetical protein
VTGAPFLLAPEIKGETWYLGGQRKRGPLDEKKLKAAMESGKTIKVGPKAHKRLQAILQGMDGTMDAGERRQVLERRRDRRRAKEGDSSAKARLRDPSPF